MEDIFVSKKPWLKGRHVDTLVIHCSAFDFRPFFAEFIEQHLKLGEYDILCVPGGIQVLNVFAFATKRFSFLRKMVEFLVKKHELKRIVILGHEDCAWYRDIRFGPIHVDLTERQFKDLKSTADSLRQELGVTIDLFFGHLTKDQQVAFSAV